MATIIKRESQISSSGTALRGVAYGPSDMASQAEAYLDGVRGEAAKIIQEAKQESARIREQAERMGHQAAKSAAESLLDEKVARQVQTLTPALASAVQLIEDSRQEWLHHWEASIIQLASAIALRIVRRELKQQPDITLTWITESLQLAGGAAEVTVRLHPTDYQTLGSQVEQLATVMGQAAPGKIIADETISLGGCVVTTEFGSIDMQLETQLARLAEEMN
ncbi:MAG: hypothetical protein MK171_09670 [Pirellulales bacterium]|nr:hypothetical protein [Pirellulales bacterium]